MELTFEITNQSLKRIDTNKPADYSNEYLKCQFDFQSEDWESMGKFAIFKTGELNYRVAINDGECIVPFDALQVNQFALTVYGIDGDTRITTNLVYIKLGKSGFVTEYDESSYFNPDMTEELLDMVEQKVYISVFDETVNSINESISLKADELYVNTELGKKANTAHTHTKSDITNFNHTHTESDITDLKDYALVSDVPTKTSDLVNDVPFLTEHQDISGKADKSYVDSALESKADTDVYDDISGVWEVMDTKSDTDYVDTALDGKQDTLTGYTDVPNLETVEITVTYTNGTTETYELLQNVGE